MRLLLDPVLVTLAAGCVSLLLGAAAIHKFTNLARFSATLEAYALLPSRLVAIVAMLLPILELGAALALVAPATRVAGAVAASALMLAYSLAITINLARGRRDLDCGCETFGRRRPIAPWMLARSALIIGAALIAAAPRSVREMTITDALTVVGGLAVLVPLYLAADELLANRDAAQRQQVPS